MDNIQLRDFLAEQIHEFIFEENTELIRNKIKTKIENNLNAINIFSTIDVIAMNNNISILVDDDRFDLIVECGKII